MIRTTIKIDGEEFLADLQTGLRDDTGLHARIAADAENFVKKRGALTAAKEHRSAETLGATPTGHLAEAYEGIESTSDARSATLLIPGDSRLRAAFGAYEVTPKKPSGFLTIPVARDSYGKRAGEFGDDLFFLLTGPKRQPVLARQQAGGDKKQPLEVLYILTRKSKIKEDRSLIPFDDLEDAALDSTEAWVEETLERSLA